MAHILRGYGLAREQAHFKLEQEADVQRHRQRLVKEGRLPPEAAEDESKQRQKQQQPEGGGFKASEQSYEILAEVLQQQARLDDPNALRRKQYERRVKGEPEPLTEAELLRARSKVLALGAAVGHVPRMSLGRTRWDTVAQAHGGGGGDLAVSGFRQLSPEAREVASRTYVAGVRALVYGSVLGAIGFAAAGTYIVHSLGITSGEDLAERIRGGMQPLSASVHRWLLPLKQRAEAWAGPAAAPSSAAADGTITKAQQLGLTGQPPTLDASGGSSPTSELSRRLQERYNPRKATDAAAGSSSSSSASDSSAGSARS